MQPAESSSQTDVARVAAAAPGKFVQPLVLVGLALVGGLLAWMFLERFDTFFEIPKPIMGKAQSAGASEEDVSRFRDALRTTVYQNTALVIAALGLAVGGLLGLGDGLVYGKSLKAAGIACLRGGLLGALFGAAGGLAGVFVAEQWNLSRGGRYPRAGVLAADEAMAIHAVAWTLLGCGVGLGVGLSSRRLSLVMQRLIMGMGAGLIAGLLYSPLSAVFFQLENSDLAIPLGTGSRLLWTVLPALILGVALCRRPETNSSAKESTPVASSSTDLSDRGNATSS